MIKDVFFDLDHTLWDFEKNSALAFQDIFKKNRLPVDLERFLAHYVPINFKYWKLFREEKISKEDLRFNRLNEAMLASGYTIEPELVHVLSQAYIEHLPLNNHLFDGVEQMLQELIKKKLRLHIITNGFKEVQAIKLKRSNLSHYFTTLTTSEDVGVKKPNPAIFDHALNKANAQKQQSIMIGDNLEADILGAESFGLKSILFDPENKTPHTGNKILHFNELKQFF